MPQNLILGDFNHGVGMHRGTYHRTEQIRAKCRKSQLGSVESEETRRVISKTHMGMRHSELVKAKISKSLIGRKSSFGMLGHKHSEATKIRMRLAHKGHKLSDEQKRKISKAGKGRKASQEARRKMSEAQKGNKKCLGKHHSEATKRKISDSLKGEKNFNWKGGISASSYAVDWTKTIRRAIRERDHYTCQVCGKEPAIICHHIDYNKMNSDVDNLIILCGKCHAKTNHNRETWVKYFYEKVAQSVI